MCCYDKVHPFNHFKVYSSVSRSVCSVGNHYCLLPKRLSPQKGTARPPLVSDSWPPPNTLLLSVSCYTFENVKWYIFFQYIFCLLLVLDFKSYLGRFCPLLSAKESHSFFSSACFIFHTSQFDPRGICLVCGGEHKRGLVFSKRLTSICICPGPSQMAHPMADSGLISPLRVFLPVFACFFVSLIWTLFIINLFSSRREKKSFWYFYADHSKFINSLWRTVFSVRFSSPEARYFFLSKSTWCL